MNEVTVSIEDDAVPVVKIFAARLKRACHHRDFRATARATSGVIAMKSAKDPQALTITVRHGMLRLARGVSKDADLTITLDFDSGKTSSISGWWRHPLLALKVDKLLKDYPTPWRDAATEFWSIVNTNPDMPTGMLIKASDEGAELVLGDHVEVEVEGKAADIADVFSGGGIFVDAVMKGRLRTDGNMKHLVVLSEATKLNLLGEL